MPDQNSFYRKAGPPWPWPSLVWSRRSFGPGPPWPWPSLALPGPPLVLALLPGPGPPWLWPWPWPWPSLALALALALLRPWPSLVWPWPSLAWPWPSLALPGPGPPWLSLVWSWPWPSLALALPYATTRAALLVLRALWGEITGVKAWGRAKLLGCRETYELGIRATDKAGIGQGNWIWG